MAWAVGHGNLSCHPQEQFSQHLETISHTRKVDRFDKKNVGCFKSAKTITLKGPTLVCLLYFKINFTARQAFLMRTRAVVLNESIGPSGPHMLYGRVGRARECYAFDASRYPF